MIERLEVFRLWAVAWFLVGRDVAVAGQSGEAWRFAFSLALWAVVTYRAYLAYDLSAELPVSKPLAEADEAEASETKNHVIP